MAPANYETISVNILSNDFIFKGSGSKLIFLGFLKVYSNMDDKDKDMDIPSTKNMVLINGIIKVVNRYAKYRIKMMLKMALKKYIMKKVVN